MLQLQNISKNFPGVKALDGVSLAVTGGEIHALCGENGAGKSTLMNILGGNSTPDEGRIMLNGKAVVIDTPQKAFSLGISIVYQHLSLVDSLNVAENIYANQHPKNALGLIQFRKLYRQTKDLLAQLGLTDIEPGTLVARLSPAQRQLVEIAKALSKKPSILVLDEPTASITEKECRILFGILRKLKSQGTAIIYISHRLEEIYLLADRVSILKDGQFQGTFTTDSLPKDQLIKRMVGREIKELKAPAPVKGDILLYVRKLTAKRFQNISFILRRGEIMGIAGLIGSGRSEIARAIFGADPFESGKILLRNVAYYAAHPSDAIAKGIAYVPEDRKSQGLFQEMSIRDNIIVGNLKNAVTANLYDQTKAGELASSMKSKLRIATPGIQQKVINLSGGNQQKVVLARWLLTNPEVLIVDEPTHGIDIGSKYEIYEILKSLAASGKGVLMISSDMPELIGICDRILVIREGKVAGELTHADATEEKIMALAAN